MNVAQDVKLLEAVKQQGKAWTNIVRTSLPGRTGLSAKNRYVACRSLRAHRNSKYLSLIAVTTTSPVPPPSVLATAENPPPPPARHTPVRASANFRPQCPHRPGRPHHICHVITALSPPPTRSLSTPNTHITLSRVRSPNPKATHAQSTTDAPT